MDWDSLRQGTGYGVLDDLVKLVAGVAVIVVVVRMVLRWLRFPDRFMDDQDTDEEPSSAGGEPAHGHAAGKPDIGTKP